MGKEKTDECEPTFMGKSLKGVKDSSISKHVFFLASYIDSLIFFCRGHRHETVSEATLCVPESIAHILVYFHKCADNVQTN